MKRHVALSLLAAAVASAGQAALFADDDILPPPQPRRGYVYFAFRPVPRTSAKAPAAWTEPAGRGAAPAVRTARSYSSFFGRRARPALVSPVTYGQRNASDAQGTEPAAVRPAVMRPAAVRPASSYTYV